MKIRVGPLGIEWDIGQPLPEELLSKTLHELLSGDVKVGDGHYMKSEPEVPEVTLNVRHATDKPKLLSILNNDLGINDKTVVMIAHKVLGVTAKAKNITEVFARMDQAAVKWFERKITEKLWAIYVAPVSIPSLGARLAVAGLNEENQLVILDLFDGTLDSLTKKLIARGLKAKDIKLGILSFHLDVKAFKKAFPNSKVSLDWKEFIDISGAMNRETLTAAMLNKNKKAVEKIISAKKGPPELLTYFDFPEPLWRALRSAAPLKRIAVDLKAKLRAPSIETEEERRHVMIWSLIRLQYHWFKIPVDAEQLKNLRHIKGT